MGRRSPTRYGDAPPSYANGVKQPSLGQSACEFYEHSRRPWMRVGAPIGRATRAPTQRGLSTRSVEAAPDRPSPSGKSSTRGHDRTFETTRVPFGLGKR